MSSSLIFWSLVAFSIINFSCDNFVQGKTAGRLRRVFLYSHSLFYLLTEAEQSPEEQSTENSKLSLKPISGSHPLDPLTATEIRLTALIIRAYNNTLKPHFHCIQLKEPEKALLVPSFLAGVNPKPGSIDRKASALIVDPITRTPYFVVVNLSTQKVERVEEGRPDQHSPHITGEDQGVVERVVYSDPGILKRFKDLGFEPSQIVLDVWEAGYVADNPNYSQARNLVQVFSYAIPQKGDNKYAYPIDFVIFFDVGGERIVGVENLPIHEGFDRTDRTGNSVPTGSATLYPPYSFYRPDVAPVAISRPKGTSFQIAGREVTWQNFRFRVGFNNLGGATIHQVSYNDNGNVRPLFYRLSLSEVYFYHGDPRPSYHRKSSFDLGNFEFGDSGETLSKEHCRGKAFFFDATIHNAKAEPRTLKNAICVVEEAAGVLWAYYDYDNDRTSVKQSQRLVVHQHVGIGNSNYLISWRFYQDATVELAIRVTGILSTNLQAAEVKATPYGNLMAPQVYTQNLQYFVGARVDADIDGVKNTVTMEDIERVSTEVDPQTNPYGNGFVIKPTVLKTAGEGRTDNSAGRTWRISNPSKLNPLNGKPASYKLIPKVQDVPNLLTPNSPLRDRITWANHNMWVLPFNDEQLIIDGIYLDCGVNKWVNENLTANIQDTDVTLWPVFGFTHTPDPENWPIVTGLPEIGFELKPSNFFTQNPAFSVPPASETTAYDDGGRPMNAGWGTLA